MSTGNDTQLDALLARASVAPPAPVDRLVAATLSARPPEAANASFSMRKVTGWLAAAAAVLVAGVSAATLMPGSGIPKADPEVSADADAFAASLIGETDVSVLADEDLSEVSDVF